MDADFRFQISDFRLRNLSFSKVCGNNLQVMAPIIIFKNSDKGIIQVELATLKEIICLPITDALLSLPIHLHPNHPFSFRLSFMYSAGK